MSSHRGAEEFPRIRAPSWWRNLARKEIRKQFGSQEAAAAAVGGSQAGISLAIHPNDTRGSTYVIPLSRVLGIPVPTGTFEDENIARLMHEAGELGPDGIEILRKVASGLNKRDKDH